MDAIGSLREVDARAGEENFPVALRVLPGRVRRDLTAVYGFARLVDELGDSYPGDRVAALQQVRGQVEDLWAGRPVDHPVVRRLGATVADRGLSRQPFLDLVEANLMDQRVSGYDTFADLLGYCRLSADPVGRIVLELFGQAAPEHNELSDRVCTALQLVEHWQDLAEDRRAGRVYLPAEDMAAYAVSPGDLDAPVASPPLRRLVLHETERAAELLAAGPALVGRLRGWARVAVAGFVAGGEATVAALRRAGGEVLAAPVRPRRTGTAGRLLWHLLAAGGGAR